MKPTLQLKIGQNLTMTPQLQQAIRLLQLSSLELQQEIQEALDSNPLLEVGDETSSEAHESEAHESKSEGTGESQSNLHESDQRESDQRESDQNEIIPNELPVDSVWDDIYQGQSSYSGGQSEDEDFNLIERNCKPETLYDHLVWQLNLTPMSELDQTIALSIIEGLDEQGYLSVTLEEIHESVCKEDGLLAEGETLEMDEILAVLHRVQQFDPPGIAARNLQECLLLQLRQLPEATPWLPQAETLVEQHLNLLSSHDYPQLLRKLKIKEDDLKATLKLIQTLNPYPGSQLQSDNTHYVVPDIIVRRYEDHWRVELNQDVSPKLRVNASYASLIQQTRSSEDSSFLKNNLQEARWFIKSLQSRNETLLKVATKIVEHQKDFLEHGEQAMKPLVLSDIAQAVEMHESTISRVTTQKYMHTPRGIYELKYFFSSHVSTSSGGECSSTAIKAVIKRLIENENKRKPLSDHKLAEILAKDNGIQAARRTVAKYRESMNIPPSNERKRLV